MKDSSTSRFLVGKKLPVPNAPDSLVKEVKIRGKDRLILFENREKIILSRTKLKNAFYKAMSVEQYNAALGSIKRLPDGKASIQIGGLEQGERRQYVTPARAAKAAENYYNIEKDKNGSPRAK